MCGVCVVGVRIAVGVVGLVGLQDEICAGKSTVRVGVGL
jgi:hypothetical protein